MGKAYAIVCQGCGIEAPSKHVEFHQIVGALIVYFHKRIGARLCKRCIHKHFWSMTGITVSVGWLGLISAIVTPFLVINNVVRYLLAMPMPPVPAGARVPVLTSEVIARIAPAAGTVFGRLNAGHEITEVVRAEAERIGVTPGELLAYLTAASRAAPPPSRPLARGFPVIMPGTPQPTAPNPPRIG